MNGKDESVPEEESDLSDQDVDFYGTPGAESSFISDAKFGFVFFFFNKIVFNFFKARLLINIHIEM